MIVKWEQDTSALHQQFKKETGEDIKIGVLRLLSSDMCRYAHGRHRVTHIKKTNEAEAPKAAAMDIDTLSRMVNTLEGKSVKVSKLVTAVERRTPVTNRKNPRKQGREGTSEGGQKESGKNRDPSLSSKGCFEFGGN